MAHSVCILDNHITKLFSAVMRKNKYTTTAAAPAPAAAPAAYAPDVQIINEYSSLLDRDVLRVEYRH